MTPASKAYAEAIREQSSAAPKRSKFGNTVTMVGNLRFDSAKEARRWRDLTAEERAGDITNLERQVSYDLHVAGVKIGRIIPDFRYRRNGKLVCEDVKSKPTMTPLFRWKQKHLLNEHGIRLELVL
jgi:hypothetical protein